MKTGPALVAIVLTAATLASAQQPNSAMASLTINALTGPPYPVTAALPTGSPAAVSIAGAAGSPFALFASATGSVQAGSGVFAGGIVDLPLSPFPGVVFDGFQNPAFNVGPAGAFVLNLVTPPAGVPPAGIPLGPVTGLQAVVADATSAFGLRLTAATQVTVTQAPVTVPLPLGTNTTLLVNLGALGITIPFYGVGHTQMFVDSNGYITFGTPVLSQFTSNPTLFAGGPPRIAGLWTALDPALGGTVNLTTGSTPAATPFVRVDYVGVPNQAGGGATALTFSIVIDATGFIQIIHTAMVTPSWYETSVGIGPGGNISPVTVKNLAGIVAAGGSAGASFEPFYGYYGIATLNPYYALPYDNPYNLFGLTLNFLPIGINPLPLSTTRYLMY